MIQRLTMDLAYFYAVLHSDLCSSPADSYLLYAESELLRAEFNILCADSYLLDAENELLYTD